jgi:serine/threonine protein kinase
VYLRSNGELKHDEDEAQGQTFRFTGLDGCSKQISPRKAAAALGEGKRGGGGIVGGVSFSELLDVDKLFDRYEGAAQRQLCEWSDNIAHKAGKRMAPLPANRNIASSSAALLASALAREEMSAKRVGDYEVLGGKQVSSGDSFIVDGKHTVAGDMVKIKVIKNKPAYDRECANMKRVLGAQNVVKLLSMKEGEPDDGQHSIVMERGKGDIATALTRSPKEMTKMAWLQDSCRGLQELHTADMVWTDLKAENFVLFEQDYETVVKCIDLDCCVMIGQCLVGYTPKCMPPELARHLQRKSPAQKFRANKSFDMWGLGLYIWRLQSGQEFHNDCYQYDDDGVRVFDEDQCITYLCDPDLQDKIDARIIATINNPKVRSVLEVLLKVDPGARTTCGALMDHSLFHSGADATKGVAATLKRIDGKVDSVQSMVQKALTTVLAMANDELQYPTTFIVLPMPSEAGGKRSLAGWFKTPDRWCNDRYVLSLSLSNYSFAFTQLH